MYTSHTLATGSLLQNSKYKIMKVLGNGGFGITYLAKHNFLEKEVAIKEFYDSNICTRNSDGSLTALSERFEKGKKDFFSEARTLAKFSNKKNIVQVNDIFKENNTIYFVMDYVEGYSLQQLIEKNGILSTSKAIKYTIDILSALVEVHQNNILHRDIKPANLLIRNTDNEIIVIDFGIAREFVQDETLTQTAMISLGYAPPEQSIASHKRTASMDLYSVGAVLYFCLTGKRPQTINELSIENYISAKEINPSIPKNIDDLINKAITKRPNERFQSAEEMIDSLNGAITKQASNLPNTIQSNDNNRALLTAGELNNLGRKYYNGRGVNKDYKKAFEYFSQAAQKGNLQAQYNLGIIYENGKGVKQDYQEAMKWYLKVAAQNYVKAQLNIAMIYKNGKGVKQDYKEAIRWFLKAAEQNYAEAQYCLGKIYESGTDLKQDYKEAITWYLKAAEQNHSDAQYSLGLMYDNGNGLRQDYQEAIKWYQKAAEQNNANAQCNLARIYHKGGVKQNFKEALKWYLKAAEQNNALAQSNLGIMYYGGIGVKKNYQESMKWLLKAAEQGNADAQYYVGELYAEGKGVNKDYYEAIKWHKKAVEQGYHDSLFCLGYVYTEIKNFKEGIRLMKMGLKKEKRVIGRGFIYMTLFFVYLQWIFD